MNDHSWPTDSLSLSMRTYYSINFIAASAHEASSAARIEAAYDGFDADKALLHKGAVAASIFMSIAAVEAYINEFFSDCADAHTPHLAGLERQAIDRLARAWTSATVVEKASILEKYQLACLLVDKEPMDLGAPAAQDLAIGIEIRNALMHFKPQSVDLPMNGTPGTLEGSWKRIGLKLKSRPPLKPSPYASQGMPEFPHRMLAHECAERTFNGARTFLQEYANHLGLTAPPFLYIFSVSRTR
jgi:hypothetical protein